MDRQAMNTSSKNVDQYLQKQHQKSYSQIPEQKSAMVAGIKYQQLPQLKQYVGGVQKQKLIQQLQRHNDLLISSANPTSMMNQVQSISGEPPNNSQRGSQKNILISNQRKVDRALSRQKKRQREDDINNGLKIAEMCDSDLAIKLVNSRGYSTAPPDDYIMVSQNNANEFLALASPKILQNQKIELSAQPAPIVLKQQYNFSKRKVVMSQDNRDQQLDQLRVQSRQSNNREQDIALNLVSQVKGAQDQTAQIGQIAEIVKSINLQKSQNLHQQSRFYTTGYKAINNPSTVPQNILDMAPMQKVQNYEQQLLLHNKIQQEQAQMHQNSMYYTPQKRAGKVQQNQSLFDNLGMDEQKALGFMNNQSYLRRPTCNTQKVKTNFGKAQLIHQYSSNWNNEENTQYQTIDQRSKEKQEQAKKDAKSSRSPCLSASNIRPEDEETDKKKFLKQSLRTQILTDKKFNSLLEKNDYYSSQGPSNDNNMVSNRKNTVGANCKVVSPFELQKRRNVSPQRDDGSNAKNMRLYQQQSIDHIQQIKEQHANMEEDLDRHSSQLEQSPQLSTVVNKFHPQDANKSEFSSYCTSLNIKKIKKSQNLIMNGGRIMDTKINVETRRSSISKRNNCESPQLDSTKSPDRRPQNPMYQEQDILSIAQGLKIQGVPHSQNVSQAQKKKVPFEKRNWHTRALLSQSAANNITPKANTRERTQESDNLHLDLQNTVDKNVDLNVREAVQSTPSGKHQYPAQTVELMQIVSYKNGESKADFEENAYQDQIKIQKPQMLKSNGQLPHQIYTKPGPVPPNQIHQYPPNPHLNFNPQQRFKILYEAQYRNLILQNGQNLVQASSQNASKQPQSGQHSTQSQFPPSQLTQQHSQSQEILIRNGNNEQHATYPAQNNLSAFPPNNGYFSINSTQQGQDPQNLFKDDLQNIMQPPKVPIHDGKQNESLQNLMRIMLCASQMKKLQRQQDAQNANMHVKPHTDPQYVLDQNVVNADLMQKAAQQIFKNLNQTEVARKLNELLSNTQNQSFFKQLAAYQQSQIRQESLLKNQQGQPPPNSGLSGSEMLKYWPNLYGQGYTNIQPKPPQMNQKYRGGPRQKFEQSMQQQQQMQSQFVHMSQQMQNIAVQGEDQHILKQGAQNQNGQEPIYLEYLNQIQNAKQLQQQQYSQEQQQAQYQIPQLSGMQIQGNNAQQNFQTFSQSMIQGTNQMGQPQDNRFQQQLFPGQQQRHLKRDSVPNFSQYSYVNQQKYYDRQRMLDFYLAIKYEDINDQVRSRAQAIAAAPRSNKYKLRFSVQDGNNSRVIRNAMLKRYEFWEETTKADPHYHLKWTPVGSSIKYESVGREVQITTTSMGLSQNNSNEFDFHPCHIQIVNHVEGHGSISEKHRLFHNLSRYCDKLNENVFDIVPLTYFIECDFKSQKQYSKTMVQFMNAFYALDDIKKRTKKLFNNIDGEEKVEDQKESSQLDDQYIFKHFYQNKIGLIKQHKREEKEEREAYGVDPIVSSEQIIKNTTGSAAQENNGEKQEAGPDQQNVSKVQVQRPWLNPQAKILRKFFYKQSMPFCHYSGHNMWILKATKLNQGQGIHVCNNLAQIKHLMQKYCEGFLKKDSENLTQAPAPPKNERKVSQIPSNKVNKSGRKISSSDNVMGNTFSAKKLNLKSPDREIEKTKRETNLSPLRQNTDQPIQEQEQDDEGWAQPETQESPTFQGGPSKSPKKDRFRLTINKKQQSEKKEAPVAEISNPSAAVGPKFKHNSFILQKYIERPLLISQRKFDIRIWVFLNPDGEAFFCKEGYLRTSSNKFVMDPDDPDNKFVHLTNIAVQKFSEGFGQHEDGNILSMQQFQDYIDIHHSAKNYSVNNDLIPVLKQQIARTLFGSRKLIDPFKRCNQGAQPTFSNYPHNTSNFFELFGYDFMLDEDFNVWLIECNTNPSIAESSKYLQRLIPKMIDDMFKLTVDKTFEGYYEVIRKNRKDKAQEPQTQDYKNALNHINQSLDGYGPDDNLWERFLHLKDKKKRKQDKQQHLCPIQINSTYAFNIKNRDFKIKKYLRYNLRPNISHHDIDQVQGS